MPFTSEYFSGLVRRYIVVGNLEMSISKANLTLLDPDFLHLGYFTIGNKNIQFLSLRIDFIKRLVIYKPRYPRNASYERE